ncbi:MAG: hypothetical protein PHV37_08510 [Candidatus Gastranaerophilales bacterium]|nr:hypothetical protein [Candidatus Gastranaerophilales bacterium]
MRKEKQIALVDCNNFFVGCEQIMNPSLYGKPVCVMSNNDGCIVSRSNEAKKLGIKMGMPYFMAKKEFPTATYITGRLGLYHAISQRIRMLLFDFSPSVEIYSIDEAFLDLTDIDKIFNLSYEELIKKIRDTIKEQTGIQVSVGLAPSKTLAKIATAKAKKGDFVYRIKKEDIQKELIEYPVESVWGIGKNLTSTFKSFGIFTAFDITKKDDDFHKKHLGKKGLELKYELLGESVIQKIDNDEKPKSIQKTSSFKKCTNDKEYIKNELLTHLHNVCAKLRRLNLGAKELCVMLRSKDFRVYVERVELGRFEDSEYALATVIDRLFERLYFEHVLYRSSGIFVNKLKENVANQLEFFRDENREKAKKISEVWDKIETKYGRNVFSVGRLPVNEKKEPH